MGMFSWFKSKNKSNVVIPTSNSSELLHGLELVKAFTTATEPKVSDFPKTLYSVYWEIVVETIGGGYSAVVRFYPYSGGTVQEMRHSAKTVDELKIDVNKTILSVMSQYRK